MSLYDGLSVETAPVPELTPQPQPGEQKADSGWTANLKLMATHLHVHRGGKTARGRGKPKAGVPRAAVLGSSGGMETATVQTSTIRPAEMMAEDDLAGEVEDEYDPMIPNNYEDIKNEEQDREERKREEERLQRKSERERERMQRRRRHSDSDSDEEREREERRRKDKKHLGAVPPPSFLASTSETASTGQGMEDGTSSQMVHSALEQLSKIKAQKKNTLFAKPFKTSTVANSIMTKYGWKEGQGLGKTSQGISTALQVEKTSVRGGKIVDMAAERKQIVDADMKKTQSMAELMKNPTKVVLLTNMVGPGEVDNELQPEVIEECGKYGDVANCLIFEMPEGAREDEAVRIFVEFTRMDSAIKAVIDLNGRFFGGRVVKGSFFSEERFARLDLVPDPSQ